MSAELSKATFLARYVIINEILTQNSKSPQVSLLCTLVSLLCTLVSLLCTLVSLLCTLVSLLCTLVSLLCTLVGEGSSSPPLLLSLPRGT